MRGRFISLTVIVVSLTAAAVAQTAKVDVSGVWIFSVESAAGSSSPTVTFKQEGEKITGHYSSQLVGDAPLVGTVKDQTIDFTITGEIQGTPLVLKYTGTIENKDSMKGKLSTEFGDGTFTAKRK
jgi:hypothetical protein